MNSISKLLFSVLLLTLSTGLYSQTKPATDDKLSLNSGTIDNQFDYVITKSNKFQDYKVVKKNWLYTLKAHTLDSLKAIQENLAATQAEVASQAKEISELKTNLSNTQVDLENTNSEKNNMSLFGLQMSKTNYNILMWSIAGGLLALLLFFIYRYKNSNAVTKEAKRNLAEIEEEFDEHRRTALEREQKVRRQLQDEINKQKNG